MIATTKSTRGEMDITAGFGPAVGGSSPSGCTRKKIAGQRSPLRFAHSNSSGKRKLFGIKFINKIL